MKLRVTNNQRYPLGRRGFTFPPGETVEIEVYSDRVYHEIAGSRYLDVDVVNEPTTVPQIANTVVTKTELENLTVPELRDLADKRGVDVPSGARKADLVSLLATGDEA